MARRRQSKTFRSLDDEAFGEYRRLCLPRDLGGAGKTLKAVVAWLDEMGVRASESMVKRDADYFAAVENAKGRLANAAEAAREIIAQATDDGGVAGQQQAAVSLYTQIVLDYLLQLDSVTTEDMGKISKLGQTLAGLTRSEITRYKAEVERKTAALAAQAKALATSGKRDIKADLAALADEILGVSK